MSVDVEEWHQTEFLREDFEGIDSKKVNVVESVSEIINTFSTYNIKATFFIVGETLRKYPKCGEIILDSGHELGFHGWNHKPLRFTHPNEFLSDLRNFHNILDEWNYTPHSFRAPSASLDNNTSWILSKLVEMDYKYDSSIFPCWTPLYGVPTAPITPYWPSKTRIDIPAEFFKSTRILEFPFLAFGPRRFRIPLGTGFYLRSFPRSLYEFVLDQRQKQGIPAVVSFHSWEFSRDLPKLRIPLLKRKYLYHRLGNCKSNVEQLIEKHSFTSIHQFSKRIKCR